MTTRQKAGFAAPLKCGFGLNTCTLAFLTLLIVGMSPEESTAQTDLAAIAAWISAEGFSGELRGAPIKALGYEAPIQIKQRAFRDGDTTHLFYVTSEGGVVLGFVDTLVTILWRFEGTHVRATAHGDMAERRMWQELNSSHAELLASEVDYWTDRWNERESKAPR